MKTFIPAFSHERQRGAAKLDCRRSREKEGAVCARVKEGAVCAR